MGQWQKQQRTGVRCAGTRRAVRRCVRRVYSLAAKTRGLVPDERRVIVSAAVGTVRDTDRNPAVPSSYRARW